MELANVLYDRHLDADEIERRLLAALAAAPSCDLGALTDLVLELHPERGNWVTLLNRLWLASDRGGEPELRAELARRRDEMGAGNLPAIDVLLAELGPRRVVLTLSNAPAVLSALAAGAGQRRVILGESRPLREGVTAARDLAAVGVDVTVVADAVLVGLPLTATELPPPLRFEREEAVVVLGADALLAEGFVAKSGSRPLCELAALAGLDVLVTATLDRLLPAGLASELSPPAADPVDLGAPAAVRPVHRPCEFVPWRLATRLVTDSESLSPAAVAERAAAVGAAPGLAARWLGRF